MNFLTAIEAGLAAKNISDTVNGVRKVVDGVQKRKKAKADTAFMDGLEDEDVPEVSYDELADPSSSDAVEPVSDASASSAPLGNSSTATPGTTEPLKTKNPLIDPTIGAQQAGIPEETLGALFAKTHGGRFNPDSRTDRLKMNAIRDMIQEDKTLLGLSPAKFALKVYARK